MFPPVPILMVLELLKHYDNDYMEHQLRVGVVGVREPRTALIESKFYESPRVQDCWGGGINVPWPVENAFLLKCFDHLAVDLGSTEIREEFIPDATHWVISRFAPAEGRILLTELRRHVTPGLVREGERYTSMFPIHCPIDGTRK